jgi:hypothetical protein
VVSTPLPTVVFWDDEHTYFNHLGFDRHGGTYDNTAFINLVQAMMKPLDYIMNQKGVHLRQ